MSNVCIARLVKELMRVEGELVKIMVYNQSAIMLRENSTHHNKHIDICYHFILNCINGGRITSNM